MALELRRVVAVFSAPKDYALPAKFVLKSHPGLIRVQVTRDGQSCHVVTTWEESANVGDEIRRFGTTGLGSFEWIENITEDRPAPRPSRIRKAFTVILPAIIAVLGGAEALRHHHAWLLAPPDFTVEPPKAGMNMLADRPAEEKWEVRNTASLGECKMRVIEITVSAPFPSGETPRRIELDPTIGNWSKAISSGEAFSETLSIPALPSGTYELMVRHIGKAGLLWRSRNVTTTAKIRSWKPWEIVPKEVVAMGTRCEFKLELHIGKTFIGPSRFEAKLSGDGAKIVMTDFPDLPGTRAEEPLQAGLGAAAVSKQRVNLSGLESFKIYPLWVRLSGVEHSQAGWQKICDGMFSDLRFYPP